jgi:hypothetical protein
MSFSTRRDLSVPRPLTRISYVANIGKIIAKHQITNGGPVILYQPENEYTGGEGVTFPNPDYMQYVIDQARNAGIVVPMISNDAYTGAHNAPGTGKGEVDICAFSPFKSNLVSGICLVADMLARRA